MLCARTQGLGREGQGLLSHIRTVKKVDAAGIGVSTSQTRSELDWTANTAAYDRILKNLAAKYAPGGSAQAQPQGAACGEDVKVETKADVVVAADDDEGAPPSRKKRKKAGKKEKKAAKEQRRAERRAAKDARKSERAAAKEANAARKADKAREAARAKAAARGTHTSRYARRKAGKAVGGYSAGDLSAILGGAPGSEPYAFAPATAPAAVAAPKPPSSPDSPLADGPSSSSDDGAAPPPMDEEEARRQREAAQKSVTMQAEAQKPQEGDSDAWWFDMFARQGQSCGGEASDSDEDGGASRKRGFDEADQERLASKAVDEGNARQGRQTGLGVGKGFDRGTGKMRGVAAFKGSKKSFSDDNDEAMEGDGDEPKPRRPFKWKKLIKQMAREAPVRWEALRDAALERAGAKAGVADVDALDELLGACGKVGKKAHKVLGLKVEDGVVSAKEKRR